MTILFCFSSREREGRRVRVGERESGDEKEDMGMSLHLMSLIDLTQQVKHYR